MKKIVAIALIVAAFAAGRLTVSPAGPAAAPLAPAAATLAGVEAAAALCPSGRETNGTHYGASGNLDTVTWSCDALNGGAAIQDFKAGCEALKGSYGEESGTDRAGKLLALRGSCTFAR